MWHVPWLPAWCLVNYCNCAAFVVGITYLVEKQVYETGDAADISLITHTNNINTTASMAATDMDTTLPALNER